MTITRTMMTHGMSLNIRIRNRKTLQRMVVATTTIKRHYIHRGAHAPSTTRSIEGKDNPSSYIVEYLVHTFWVQVFPSAHDESE